MTDFAVTPADVREFCSRHAFVIGTAFEDETIARWVTDATNQSKRFDFWSDRSKCMWILAFVCRECCENGSEGPDRVGTRRRYSFSEKFEDIMRRQEC